MLAPFSPYKRFGFINKEGEYSRYSMIDFPLLWIVTSGDYYSSMKDKYKKLYVRSSCLSTTLQFTDTKKCKVEEIADILCHISNEEILIQYKLSYKGYCRQLC